MQEATAKLSNMAQVAQSLGDVMQNDLVAMFDKAKLAASQLPEALSILSDAMHTSGTSASVMQDDILNVVQRLLNLHTSLPTISALLNTMGINISVAGVKALIASVSCKPLVTALAPPRARWLPPQGRRGRSLPR